MTAMAYLNPSSSAPIRLCPIAVSVGRKTIIILSRKGTVKQRRSITQQNINSCFTHVIVNIEYFSDFLAQSIHNIQTVAVECADERLQYILMKCWCNEFAMCAPVIAGTDEQTISKPRFEETIFVWFIDVNMTAQNNFNVNWICQENQQFWSDPHTSNVSVLFAHFHGQFQNFWEATKKVKLGKLSLRIDICVATHDCEFCWAPKEHFRETEVSAVLEFYFPFLRDDDIAARNEWAQDQWW